MYVLATYIRMSDVFTKHFAIAKVTFRFISLDLSCLTLLGNLTDVHAAWYASK